MFDTIDTLEEYVFGTGLRAGIASISGDAGGHVDAEMSFDIFKEIISEYLDHEDDEDESLDLPALHADFENEKYLRTLYIEFRARYS